MPKNPLEHQGDFLFEHKQLTDPIDIVDVRRSTNIVSGKHGTAYLDTYVMSNGFEYDTITSLPYDQKTSIPVDMNTAWGTSAKLHSHNGRSLGVFVAEGFPARLYGPPRLPKLPKHPFKFLGFPQAMQISSRVTMDSDIAVYAAIADDLDSIHKYHIEPGVQMRYGESRGIMTGLGAVALDEHLGRKTLWLEGVDPCIPEKLEIKDLAFDPKTIGEVLASVKTLRHILTEARRLKYIDTLDPTLEYLLPGIMTYKTLFSGRAGEYADNIPIATQGNIAFFDSSVANGYETFMEKLDHAPDVRTQLLKGGHLTLAAREMVYRSAARLVSARDAIEENGEISINEIQNIYDAQPLHIPKIGFSSLPLAA